MWGQTVPNTNMTCLSAALLMPAAARWITSVTEVLGSSVCLTPACRTCCKLVPAPGSAAVTAGSSLRWVVEHLVLLLIFPLLFSESILLSLILLFS